MNSKVVDVLASGANRPLLQRGLLLPHRRSASSAERSSGWLLPWSQHGGIKKTHQLAGCLVVHFPKARYHTRCASMHKASRQPHQPFAADILAECGIASAQDH